MKVDYTAVAIGHPPRFLTILSMCVHLRLLKSFDNLQTEHDMEMNLTPIDFSRWGTECFTSTWLQTLGNQLIDHSPYIRYTNRKCYLLYNISWRRLWISSERAFNIVYHWKAWHEPSSYHLTQVKFCLVHCILDERAFCLFIKHLFVVMTGKNWLFPC